MKLPIGSSFGFGITRPVGATLYLPDVIAPEADQSVTVDLRSITAHIRTNTADATVTVLTCVQTGEIAVVGSPKLPSCRDATPFRAGTLRLADRRGADGLAVRITLRRPGKLVIDGFTFTYRDGIRTGNGRSDVIITAKAVAPGS